jgi:excisionase family DNA binding protein
MTDTLRELLTDPERLRELKDEEVAPLLIELTTMQLRLAALAECLLARTVSRSDDRPDDDRLLQVDEAASRLGVDARWIRRRARTLPFVRRLSGKAIRVSEEGLKRWVSMRRAA